jgi:hypothetical protein
MSRVLAAAVFLVALLPQEPPERDAIRFFEQKIRPVLVDRCYSCHSAEASKVKGGLVLDTREGLLKGGDEGPALKPGDPDASLLIKAVRYKDELKMPPKGKLTDAQIADLEAWVKRGAPDPRTGPAKAAGKRVIDLEEGRKYWAVQPLRPVAPPAVKNGAWARTVVDRFILAKLEEKGLAPNAPADRRRLLRRAAFGLTGLPPSPEELDAFASDAAPDAWEKAVDRLLASPHFGERWARHWLDVARFAESHGFEQDYDREGAWPYRDFVVRAFNADLPYDRFVGWQIAGDELAPDDPLAWMATGFLGAGSFPTQLTEAEFESSRYEELDDMASTVGSAMLGLSVGCARCHDHKYDPIPAADYYRLISTFTKTIRSHVEFDLDPESTRKALAAWELEDAPLAAALAKFERDELPGRFARWAASKPWESEAAAEWVLLEPAETKSSGGASFQLQPDGSLLVGGKNPDRDRWTITAKAPAGGKITAVRLESLKDASLKKGGPGRADNGNFALSDFRVKADGAVLKIASARATFEQNTTSLSIAASVDADPVSGWAVDPQVGRDHAAVFELAEPAAGEVLVFELSFNNNARHAIGRLRLSVSTRPKPALEGAARPAALAALLETLRSGRDPGPQALETYRTLDSEWLLRSRPVEEHLAKKPKPKLTKIQVSTEGLKPLKHHADDRGFPHFYPETHFLARGDVHKKQGVAPQGFLQVLVRGADAEARWAAQPGPRTPGRRSALVKWMTDLDRGAGGLLARVVVNRLWAQHFGRGIVATPNDFGVQGEPPSHPELLEWLAGELVRNGWRLKPIHRLILSSAAYRQSSEADPAKAKLDPDGRLFWRWGLRRLEGEAIRDSVLDVSGLLDRTMYGPGTLDESMRRRSLYFFVKRSRLIPMLMVFDAPEPLVSQGARPTTTIAPQALLFMNSPLVRKAAQALARRAGSPEVACRLALGRTPTPPEAAAAAGFLRAQEESYRGAGRSDAKDLALADYCQALLSSNEFVYVD